MAELKNNRLLSEPTEDVNGWIGIKQYMSESKLKFIKKSSYPTKYWGSNIVVCGSQICGYPMARPTCRECSKAKRDFYSINESLAGQMYLYSRYMIKIAGKYDKFLVDIANSKYEEICDAVLPSDVIHEIIAAYFRVNQFKTVYDFMCTIRSMIISKSMYQSYLYHFKLSRKHVKKTEQIVVDGKSYEF
jgi:hypothetical protein